MHDVINLHINENTHMLQILAGARSETAPYLCRATQVRAYDDRA